MTNTKGGDPFDSVRSNRTAPDYGDGCILKTVHGPSPWKKKCRIVPFRADPLHTLLLRTL